ncbi:hypothetical protein MRB53_041792 [Persea americana]|nr:hypothetical protein MRB53_041792 [Persea americana]
MRELCGGTHSLVTFGRTGLHRSSLSSISMTSFQTSTSTNLYLRSKKQILLRPPLLPLSANALSKQSEKIKEQASDTSDEERHRTDADFHAVSRSARRQTFAQRAIGSQTGLGRTKSIREVVKGAYTGSSARSSEAAPMPIPPMKSHEHLLRRKSTKMVWRQDRADQTASWQPTSSRSKPFLKTCLLKSRAGSRPSSGSKVNLSAKALSVVST